LLREAVLSRGCRGARIANYEFTRLIGIKWISDEPLAEEVVIEEYGAGYLKPTRYFRQSRFGWCILRPLQ
jgi:hypothetical protein